MAFSAEESSPVAYVTESCCVCDEEFSSDSQLANHLVEHGEDPEFKSFIEALDQKSDANLKKAAKQTTLSKNFTCLSTSPEVWEIVSDDSDEDKGRAPKSGQASNSFRLVGATGKTPTKAATLPPPQQQKRSAKLAATEGDASHTCKTCLAVFNDSKSFREHVLTHEKPRPYICQICNKGFAYKGTLRQHLHLHIGEKSHECKTCHKKFTIKSLLKKHEQIHAMQLVRDRMNSQM